jgi:hypothetical protein
MVVWINELSKGIPGEGVGAGRRRWVVVVAMERELK